MSNGNNRTKQLRRRAHELRIKERRLRAQGGDKTELSRAERRGYDAGYEAGRQAGLREALELASQNRRMIGYIHELRKLIGGT